MRLLLRIAQQDEQGFESFSDVEFNQEQILLGTSQDSDIQLLGPEVRQQHAQIKGNKIKCKSGAKGSLNGKSMRSAQLNTGDELEIGGHRLAIVQAPPGFDLAIEWYKSPEAQGAALESAYTTQISDTLFSKRKLSYLLLAVVLVIGLVLPIMDYQMTKDVVVDTEQPDALDALYLPWLMSDKLWSTGPLAPPHQVTLGDQCTTCHKQAFQQVQDKQCTNCHQNMPTHLPANHPEAEGWQEAACQACHKEHNEPESLIVDNDVLCVDCHADTEPSVSDFNIESHPPFKVTLLSPAEDLTSNRVDFSQLQWQAHHRSMNEENVKETSNLKFPHDVHLNPDKVQHQASGEAMLCADCHTLSADKEHFLPIEMEQHCIDCHELRFDEREPDRQLPHGEVVEAARMLEAHYVRQFADPDYGSQNQRRRRRPGRDRGGFECEGPALKCGRQQAAIAINQQFTQRGCVTCHEVKDSGSGDLYTRWQILPVKIHNDWFSLARFNHQSHLTQTGQSESMKCLSCHEAEQSHQANDILMPTLQQCTDCHGESDEKARVPLNCIQCHQYHHPATALEYHSASQHSLTDLGAHP